VLAFKNDSVVRVFTPQIICPTANPLSCYVKPVVIPNGTISLLGPYSFRSMIKRRAPFRSPTSTPMETTIC